MDDKQREILAQSILEVTGVAVNVIIPQNQGLRSSLLVFFEGYGSQEGPRFEIKAHGLKSHKIIATMGIFAAPCIRQMQAANCDQLTLARSLVRELAEKNHTKLVIHHNQTLDSWVVHDTNFSIEITTRVIDDQYSNECVILTATKFMAPLLAAFAELIGYIDLIGVGVGDDEDFTFDMEGQLTLSTILKRERSRRNRLLCLSIHGNQCSVCGSIPEKDYPGLFGIIEIHHIEPISKLLKPRIYDPRTDLIPLCPNCHRAIHRTIPAMHPKQLRAIIKTKK